MQDLPPAEIDPAPVPIEVPAASSDAVIPHLPMEEREDGTLVIDLTPLAPPPPQQCVSREPDPLNPEIVVCGETAPSPRLNPYYGPTDEDQFGSAIPRAQLRLSEHATVELNGAQSGVGGFVSRGGEARLKIDF